MNTSLLTTILFCGIVVKNLFDMIFYSIIRFSWRVFGRDIKSDTSGIKALKTRRSVRTFKAMSFLSAFIDVLEFSFFFLSSPPDCPLTFKIVSFVIVIKMLIGLLTLMDPMAELKIGAEKRLKMLDLSVKFGFFKNIVCFISFLVYLFYVVH